MKNEEKPIYKIPEIGLYDDITKGTYNRPKIEEPDESYHALKMVWDENRIDLLEEFKVILVDTNMKCIAISHVCIGKYGGCIAEPRQIFSTALKYHASGLVLAHNHPDGDLRPRKSDFDITEKMAFGGSILGIQIHDHLILSSKGYLSFAKEKMMPQPMYL